jgi:hypothetical protein
MGSGGEKPELPEELRDAFQPREIDVVPVWRLNARPVRLPIRAAILRGGTEQELGPPLELSQSPVGSLRVCARHLAHKESCTAELS